MKTSSEVLYVFGFSMIIGAVIKGMFGFFGLLCAVLMIPIITMIAMMGYIYWDKNEYAFRIWKRNLFGREGSWKWALKQMREGHVVISEELAWGVRRKIISGQLMTNNVHLAMEILTAKEIEEEGNKWSLLTFEQAGKNTSSVFSDEWKICDGEWTVAKPPGMPSISLAEADAIGEDMMRGLM